MAWFVTKRGEETEMGKPVSYRSVSIPQVLFLGSTDLCLNMRAYKDFWRKVRDKTEYGPRVPVMIPQ